jgi:hypothetical protein
VHRVHGEAAVPHTAQCLHEVEQHQDVAVGVEVDQHAHVAIHIPWRAPTVRRLYDTDRRVGLKMAITTGEHHLLCT